jgi:hypothetical protein
LVAEGGKMKTDRIQLVAAQPAFQGPVILTF